MSFFLNTKLKQIREKYTYKFLNILHISKQSFDTLFNCWEFRVKTNYLKPLKLAGENLFIHSNSTAHTYSNCESWKFHSWSLAVFTHLIKLLTILVFQQNLQLLLISFYFPSHILKLNFDQFYPIQILIIISV